MPIANPNIAIAANYDFSDPARNRRFFDRRQHLAYALRERGASPIVLEGSRNRLGRLGLFSSFYEFGDNSLIPRTNGVIAVSSALDLTGGVGKFVPGMPSLNPESVRRLGKSKALQAEVLRPVVGEAVPESILVSNPTLETVLDAIAEIHTSSVVVKPDFTPGKKIEPIIGTKSDVAARLPGYIDMLPPSIDLLVQEYMQEVEGPFHSSLDFSTKESDIKSAYSGERNEIRMYFVDGKLVTSYGRLDAKDAGFRVFYDPASLPEHAVELGHRAASALTQKNGSLDSHLAVDVTPDGKRIIEVNARDIEVVLPNPERPFQMQAHHSMTSAQADTSLWLWLTVIIEKGQYYETCSSE